jgi:hypothetical protein
VSILTPEGVGTLAVFETERAAEQYADRTLPDHPGSRAWILWLGQDRAELIGSRGGGQWMRDRVPAFHVAPLAGGAMTSFHTHEDAREHAPAGSLILGVGEDGRVLLERVP